MKSTFNGTTNTKSTIGNNVKVTVTTERKSQVIGIPIQPSDVRYGNHKGVVESRNFTALFNHILGEMLTIADASFTDQEQRNAVKEMMKRTIWSNYEPLQEWLHHEEHKEECGDCEKNHPPFVFPF